MNQSPPVRPSEPSWFSAGLIPDPAAKDRLIVVRYWFDWNPTTSEALRRQQIKFPGGSKKAGIDLTPEDTLARELNEEVFLTGRVLRHTLLHSETDQGMAGPKHTKHFFLVQGYQGELRREDLFEEERGTAENPQGPIRTERIAAPEFVRVGDLAGVIFRRHAGALLAYCEHLADENRGTREARKAVNILRRRLQRPPG